jgi:hypothetical protein
VSLRLTLQLPAGFRPVELPRTLRLSTPFGRFHLQATARPGAVDLQRELWVPFRIVGPGQYARFTEFAARVDRAERVTVVLDKR